MMGTAFRRSQGRRRQAGATGCRGARFLHPGASVTLVFTFVFAWNEFLFAVFLTYDKAQTMPVALQKTIDAYNVLWGSLSAGAVFQLLPMVLVVFLLQRHIARGLALGAVK